MIDSPCGSGRACRGRWKGTTAGKTKRFERQQKDTKMQMKKMVLLAALGVAVQMFAAVSVTNVVCRQRYPWNGLVDIDYEIVSDDAEAKYWVYPKGTDNRLGKRVIMNTLSGDGATNYVGVGTHRMIWDAKTDMPNFHTPDLQVTLQVIANAAKYLVIDVSNGSTAPFYNMRYSTEPPDLSDDTCRTDEIWLRLVLPGTFVMGSPANEAYRVSQAEDQHLVTLTKPYYMGVFEFTQKQYENVMGANPAGNKGDCRPVENVSYNDIRGSVLGAKWPNSHEVDTNSIMGILRAKTQLTLDLPTDAQWEYACRAGTTTSLNSGKNVTYSYTCAELNEVGRYGPYSDEGTRAWNIGGYSAGTAPVGYFMPNNLGLYDMHGNVEEWCLDYYNSYVGTLPVTDPVGWTGGNRVLRGGSWVSYAKDCRSATRGSDKPSGRSDHRGFRVVVLPFE